MRREADAASCRAGRRARRLPGRAGARHEGALQPQDRHRADRLASRIICGGTSACVEPIPANIYTHKTLSGSFTVRNPHLQELLDEKGLNTDDTWQSIVEHEGSVAASGRA